MSLLLDALKKAEKAKDDAKRRAELGSDSGPSEDGSHVRTRNELPDISKPLDINSEDIGKESESSSPVPDAFSTAPRSRSAPVSETGSRAPAPDPAPRQRPQEVESRADTLSAQKVAAKKVFEAKFREPNPKLPFYITMAVLGLFSIGTVIYFWYQLRPPPPLVNTNAKAPSDEKKMDPPPQQAPALPLPAQSQPSEIPGLPGQSPVAASAPAASAMTAPKAADPLPIAPKPIAPVVQAPKVAPTIEATKPPPARTTAQPQSSRQPPRGEPPAATRSRAPSGTPARASTDSSRLSVSRGGPRVDPRIDSAWQAYNAGDLQSARTNYQAMLRDDPMNRDALLGMAAVEIRSNRPEQASTYYQSILQSNPRDTHAQAGLLALRSQMGDAVQNESRVKSMLASDPDAQVLHFTLGNQYAQQGRWPEAQQAFFKAFSAEPENPDFAYNLAVSLDQLRQPKLALEYYRRAISLSQQRASSFDQTLARNRIHELAR